MTGLARKQRKQRKSRRRSRYARKTRRRKGAGDDEDSRNEYEKIFEIERQEPQQPEMDPSVLDDAARIAALDDEDEILARLRQQLEALGTWTAEHGNNGNGNINVNVANIPIAPTHPARAPAADDIPPPSLSELQRRLAELNTPTAPPPLAIPVGQAPLATTIDPANVNNARNIPTAPGAWSGGDKRRRKSKKGRRSRRRKRRRKSRRTRRKRR